jgi:aspartate-semialdehyde dehydrogenase
MALFLSASGAGANNMRELLKGMGAVNAAVAAELADKNSAILDIDRKVAEFIRYIASIFYGSVSGKTRICLHY